MSLSLFVFVNVLVNNFKDLFSKNKHDLCICFPKLKELEVGMELKEEMKHSPEETKRALQESSHEAKESLTEPEV